MEKFKNWWYFDNIISHRGQIGLLSMNEPRVFILIRDYADCYFANFDEFKNSIAEVNFFDPEDRQTADIGRCVELYGNTGSRGRTTIR